MRYLAPILLLASFACAQTQGGHTDGNCIQMTPEDIAAGKPVPSASGPCAQTPGKPKPLALSDLTATTSNWSIRLPEPMITIGGTGIIEVMDKDGKLLIRIDRDGHSILGDGYHPDEGAKLFWEALAKYYPLVCAPPPKPATIAPKEGHPQ